MPTAARSLLDRGLALLGQQFFETFTVDGHEAVPLKGLVEIVSFSNTIEQGGFLPESGGVLAVPRGEFEKLKLTPWPGMRVTVRGRTFIASTIEDRYNQWALRLEQSFPKTSDVPEFTEVLGTADGHPLEYQAGQIEVNPS